LVSTFAFHTWTIARSSPAVVRFRRERAVLAAPCRRDERAVVARAREDDVAWLVAGRERPRHVRQRDRHRIDLDDADAVREVVDDPGLDAPGEVGSRGDGDRLEPDRHLGGERQRAHTDGVDREPVVGRVDGEQLRAVGRKD
jgi:hypothetical protein